MPPRRTASRTVRPCRRRSFMNDTSTMPFSIATPNTAMNPIAEGTETYCPVTAQGEHPADDRERHVGDDERRVDERIERGVEQDEDQPMVSGTITASRASARCWFSKAPPQSSQ